MKLAHHSPVSIFILQINNFVLQPLYRKGFSKRGNRRLCVRTSQNGVVPDAHVPALVLVCDALIFLLLGDDPDDLWRAFSDHGLPFDDEFLKACEVAFHAKVCAVIGHCADWCVCVHGISAEGF